MCRGLPRPKNANVRTKNSGGRAGGGFHLNHKPQPSLTMFASAPPRPVERATPAPTRKEHTRVRIAVKFATPKNRSDVTNDAGYKWRWLVDAFSGFHVAFPQAPPTARAVLAGFIPPVLDKVSGKWQVLDGRGMPMKHARPRSRAVAVTERTSRTLTILLRGDGTMPPDAVPQAVARADALFRDQGGVSVHNVAMTSAAFDVAWRRALTGRCAEYILAYLPAACCNCGKTEGIGCTCVKDRQNLPPLLLCDRCKQLPKDHPPEKLCGYSPSAGRRKGWVHGGCYATWDERNGRLASLEVATAWLGVCKASCTQPGMCRVAPNPFCAPVSDYDAALDPWVGAWWAQVV